MEKKILMLDIDGVLNNDEDLERTHKLGASVYCMCRFKLELLREISLETGCHIVLSSDWRLRHNPNGTAMVKMCLAMFGMSLYGSTPEIGTHVERAEEIYLWLHRIRKKGVDVTRLCILDDLYGAGSGMRNHFIYTNPEQGLLSSHVSEAIKMLGPDGPDARKIKLQPTGVTL